MLPTLEGFTFRYLRDKADYKDIAEIETAANTANQIEEALTEEQITNEFEYPTGIDPFTDVLLAEADGRTVGYTKVTWRINDENNRIYWQWGFVRPEWMHKGVGRALLSFTEARAKAHAVANPHSGPSYLRGVGEDTAYGKIALFEQNAYPVIRYFCFMQRPTLDDLPEAPLPPGLELRPATVEQMRIIWDAKEDGFRDHWGFAPKSENEYLEWKADSEKQVHLWQVVWDKATNEIAGVSINEIKEPDNELYGFKRGWINSLAVRRPYRKQGLAKFMLVSGMQVLRDHGMTEAVLGVDAENPHNALRLYESVGFKILNKDAVYQKAI
jgi:GNAT superfamily N-acetyltransferase